MRLLGRVQALHLPDCWIGAGFVRSAVWDHLHDRVATRPGDDVDVIWFDRERASRAVDRDIEAQLKAVDPAIDWSVKNQARMHRRNNDEPYRSTEDAVSRWPETATAVALRLTVGGIDIMAPFGLDDLFSLVVRPTPAFAGEKRPVFQRRVQEKRWLERWPRLVLSPG